MRSQASSSTTRRAMLREAARACGLRCDERQGRLRFEVADEARWRSACQETARWHQDLEALDKELVPATQDVFDAIENLLPKTAEVEATVDAVLADLGPELLELDEDGDRRR